MHSKRCEAIGLNGIGWKAAPRHMVWNVKTAHSSTLIDIPSKSIPVIVEDFNVDATLRPLSQDFNEHAERRSLRLESPAFFVQRRHEGMVSTRVTTLDVR